MDALFRGRRPTRRTKRLPGVTYHRELLLIQVLELTSLWAYHPVEREQTQRSNHCCPTAYRDSEANESRVGCNRTARNKSPLSGITHTAGNAHDQKSTETYL